MLEKLADINGSIEVFKTPDGRWGLRTGGREFFSEELKDCAKQAMSAAREKLAAETELLREKLLASEERLKLVE